VWEENDPEVRKKIAWFAEKPELVVWSGSAERDIANTRGVTKAGVLEGILDHCSCGFIINGDHMKNGDTAFILDCFVGLGHLYVKVKFIVLDAEECMKVFAAHQHK
jgi:hypothetical protein